MRWITEALQYARYKQPAAGLPIKKLVNLSEEHSQKKISSTSSHLDCLPSPPSSPEARSQRRKAVSGKRTSVCSSCKIFQLTFHLNGSWMSFYKRSKRFPFLPGNFNNHFPNHSPLSIPRSFYNLYNNVFALNYSEYLLISSQLCHLAIPDHLMNRLEGTSHTTDFSMTSRITKVQWFSFSVPLPELNFPCSTDHECRIILSSDTM